MRGISPSSLLGLQQLENGKGLRHPAVQPRLAVSHTAAQQLANRLPPILVQPVAEQLHVVMSHCQLNVAHQVAEVNDAINVAVDNSDHVHNY